MSDDTISRQMAIDATQGIFRLATLPDNDAVIRMSAVEYVLFNLPSAQPERIKGRWIYKKDLKQFFCDQCGEPSLTEDDRYIYSMDFSNFCPNCGARMEDCEA